MNALSLAYSYSRYLGKSVGKTKSLQSHKIFVEQMEYSIMINVMCIHHPITGHQFPAINKKSRETKGRVTRRG